jgi:extracellular matrix regulatory protein A
LNKLVNIGFGNVVNSSKIISIISPEAAPIKRMVQATKDNGMAIDATCGRRTKAVIVMESGHLILSSLLPETIAGRVNQAASLTQKEISDPQDNFVSE